MLSHSTHSQHSAGCCCTSFTAPITYLGSKSTNSSAPSGSQYALSCFIMVLFFGSTCVRHSNQRSFRQEMSHTNTPRFISLLKHVESFTFWVSRLHHLLKMKQSNRYSFELESFESVSLINARGAAGCASFYSLPNLLREDFLSL